MTVQEICALLKVRKWFVYDAVRSQLVVCVKRGWVRAVLAFLRS